jgi:signal transduction histidine kinase
VIPQSIRWRLALSYAAIALLAALVLGAVLLTILQSYYSQRELDYLRGNAKAIGQGLSIMIESHVPTQALQLQVENFSFLSQTRVRALDTKGQVLQDSGVPKPVDVAVGTVKRAFFIRDQRDQSGGGSPSDYVRIISIGNGLTGGNVLTETLPITKTALRLEMPLPDGGEVVAYKSMPVAGALYGFGLNPDVALDERRSNQVVRQPFSDDAGTLLGYVELSDGPAYGRDILDSVARGWALSSAVAVLLAAGAGWLVSRRISAPVLALTAATARMAAGDLGARAGVAGEDEFGRLGRSFNIMAGRVETTICALRRFVSDAAHELHTPLTALRTNLELAAGEGGDSAQRAFVERAQEQIERLEALTGELLDLSRIEADLGKDHYAPLDLAALTRRTSELYASRAEQAGLAFELDGPEGAVTIRGSQERVTRVLDNLLDNAIKFTPGGGMVSVKLRQQGGWAELWVQDTGIGIPVDDLPQLFSRFHRGHNATSYPGSGLGLAIVAAIVEGHGGQVTAENTAPGARFCVRLPLAGHETSQVFLNL